jgi:hypothetical protein
MKESCLEKEFNKYCQIVELYAEEKFNNIIKPFLIKNNYKFVSGNGTFYIYYDDPDNPLGLSSADIDKLPGKIYNVLEEEIPGMRGISLGAYMPNFMGEQNE